MRGRILSTFVVALCAGLVATGCDDGGTGRRYRAERDFRKAQRALQKLDVNPDLVGKNDLLALADRFNAVGVRYIGAVPEGDTTSTSSTDEAIARIAARAKLVAAQLYLRGGDTESAKQVSLAVRDEMAWAPPAAMLGQVGYIDALRREDDDVATVAELWRLAEEYPAASEDGAEVNNPVINAPMGVVRSVGQRGGNMDAAIERALAYYSRVRERWPGRTPALLSDLHRSSLYDIRGDWQRSADVLEGVLDGYPETVLAPAEAARIAYTLGQLLASNRRDVPRAVQAFARARAAAPGSPPAWDATLALAEYHGSKGEFQTAADLCEEVVEGNTDDRQRAAEAKFREAQYLERAGRWDAARIAVGELETAYPNTSQAQRAPFFVAAHYREVGENEIADSVLRRAEEQFREKIREANNADEAAAWYEPLFNTLTGREEWAVAVQEMETFVEIYPEHSAVPDVLTTAARIAAEKLHDKAKAVALLQRVEDGYPQTPAAERAQAMMRELGD